MFKAGILSVVTGSPNSSTIHWPSSSLLPVSSTFSTRSAGKASAASSFPPPPSRVAVLGAGFAGLSVVWHLLQQHTSEKSPLCIDIYDEVGIGGGASGVSGGLLHPYSPKAKLLWKGADCWNESLNLLKIAETAVSRKESIRGSQNLDPSAADELIVWRRGILRPATTMKNEDILKENSRNCLRSCRIESLDKDNAQNLVPNLCVPLNSAIYMPQAVNIHPKRYLQALFLACNNLVKHFASLGYQGIEMHLHQKSINSLLELEGNYDAVIICLGAKVDMIEELSGKLPLRSCRGVVAHLQLPENVGDEYGDFSPSILSDAWLAVQGRRKLVLGSTWDWKSKNYSSCVSAEEASMALRELVPKASAIYPCIRKWDFMKASAGVRAMPPLTPNGSIPLLGCVDHILLHYVGNKDYHKHPTVRTKYWLFGGLGSRGLLYHAWLGKLMARAVISCDENILPRELTSWRKAIDRD